MDVRRLALITAGTAVALAIVAGCTSSSDGNGTPSPVATSTVTTTDTVSSANPPTGSGVPASSTAPAGGSTGSGNASGPGLCTPTVMTFDVTASEGAAGSSYFLIHATNGSASPCVTTGFPGMALLDASGKQILQADRDDPSKVTTITVAPGGEITSQVRAANMGNGSATCPSSPAFLLTLPDNTDSTKITHTTPACSVSVAAFVKGGGS